MDILIQFPTRKRKEKFLKYLQRYVETLSGKNEVTININCDTDDSEMNNQDTVDQIKAIYSNSIINFDDNLCKIEAINNNLDDKTFDVLVNAADDMWPTASGWDEEIRKGFEEHFPNYDGCLHYDDGFQRDNISTLCIIGKPYYDRFGYIYHPDYKSLWCDNEFTDVARSLSRIVYLSKIIIRHAHPCITHEKPDVVYRAAEINNKRDEVIYWKRRNLDFPQESVLS